MGDQRAGSGGTCLGCEKPAPIFVRMNYALRLSILVALLAGCTKKDTPAPPTVVAVHYTTGGAAMQFRGRVHVGNLDHAGRNPGNYFDVLVNTPTLAGTREVVAGMPAYLDDYDLTVQVYLEAAERSTIATFPVPAGTFVQAEILVNGQVRKTVRVDETTTLGPYDLYPTQTISLPFKGL
jgi:hypothetical protein